MPSSEILTMTFEALSREQIRHYCEASGDWNKIHWDEAFAREAGLPSVIAHGMLTMGLASRLLVEKGLQPRLKSFDSKFKEKALPGDTLTATLSWISETEGRIDMKNQKGDDILLASFSLA